MGRMNVTITDVTDNRIWQASVPKDVPVQLIITALIEKMGLPQHDSGGNLISYQLVHKASGSELSKEKTLKDAGIQEEEVFRLQLEVTTG